jgi:hypothetical protein
LRHGALLETVRVDFVLSDARADLIADRSSDATAQVRASMVNTSVAFVPTAPLWLAGLGWVDAAG